MPESVTYVLGMICNLCAGKHIAGAIRTNGVSYNPSTLVLAVGFAFWL